MSTASSLFDEILDLPDPKALRTFAGLVGLEEAKERLIKEARLVLNPQLLQDWSVRHHRRELSVVDHFRNRPCLFLFGGDVGSGKTTLAESFGDAVARQEKIAVRVYRLSLNARGTGAVGEMTQLISAAFREIATAAHQGAGTKVRASTAMILVIDEADALAQSRGLAQMHHEDRAGVNVLIRGIDELSGSRLPVIVVMCTNRLNAIDPAILRRAAHIIEFGRPDEAQRLQVLSAALDGAGFAATQLQTLAKITGPNGTGYGFTYSDLLRRLIPALVIDAFPERPIEFDRAYIIAKAMKPTPPFQSATAP